MDNAGRRGRVGIELFYVILPFVDATKSNLVLQVAQTYEGNSINRLMGAATATNFTPSSGERGEDGDVANFPKVIIVSPMHMQVDRKKAKIHFPSPSNGSNYHRKGQHHSLAPI